MRQRLLEPAEHWKGSVRRDPYPKEQSKSQQCLGVTQSNTNCIANPVSWGHFPDCRAWKVVVIPLMDARP